MLSARRIDDYVTNHVVDCSYRGINLRDLTDEEIEDNAQKKLDRMEEADFDETYDRLDKKDKHAMLEAFIYDSVTPSSTKARVFEIDTEVEVDE
ncbi:hypothetical protein QYM39_04180 [Pediococcus pentosaceus]|uniref:hypothetical protein n=1 Tax=Pediococcus pentosaceus TaxID=1255 RepID=UPI002659CEED|nr:hypothetical protein [Pediococcus pentosaceus]WKF71856.1 hypothetical protein QYM39_04180 [Pediococcus pentosaceus]